MPLRHQFATEEEWIAHMRLWFAGMALQGIHCTLSDGERLKSLFESARARKESLDYFIAAMAYDAADAMLEARKK